MQIRDAWMGEPIPDAPTRFVFTFCALGRVEAEILLLNRFERIPEMPSPISYFARIY
jgi:hypothetical protein